MVSEISSKCAICDSCNGILHFTVENDAPTKASIIFEYTVFKFSLRILADMKESVIPSRVVPEN